MRCGVVMLLAIGHRLSFATTYYLLLSFVATQVCQVGAPCHVACNPEMGYCEVAGRMRAAIVAAAGGKVAL